MTPKEHYALDLKRGDIFPDDSQESAVEDLQIIYDGLVKYWKTPRGLWQEFLIKLGRPSSKPVLGLYLWGGVGRGKTYLMDKLFHCLPGDRKMRMHFHRFMQMIHRRLLQYKGQENPLSYIAQDLSKEVDVICFDEFFVSDIGDAMILANLLDALFKEGITLVATSNIAPDLLYSSGSKRAKFLPAIDLLNQNTKVVNMDGEVDYRLRDLSRAQIFYTPLDNIADSSMLNIFEDMSKGQETAKEIPVEILGRDIQTCYLSDGLAWFDFDALCRGPRSATDYIEVAQLFHTVFLSNIPQFNHRQEDNEARRFISLIDELYDHKVKMIISTEVPIEQLYQGKELKFPFERTESRLLEMQSHDYLALEHKP